MCLNPSRLRDGLRLLRNGAAWAVEEPVARPDRRAGAVGRARATGFGRRSAGILPRESSRVAGSSPLIAYQRGVHGYGRAICELRSLVAVGRAAARPAWL